MKTLFTLEVDRTDSDTGCKATIRQVEDGVPADLLSTLNLRSATPTVLNGGDPDELRNMLMDWIGDNITDGALGFSEDEEEEEDE